MKKIIQILILFHCISWKVSAQPNWSVEDLHVTAFRNGESLMQANSIDNWKYCSANQIPAYYLIGDSPEDGVLYNYYALINDQQLAPEGYRIAELEDVKALPSDQYYQSSNGGWKTNKHKALPKRNLSPWFSLGPRECLDFQDKQSILSMLMVR